MNSSFKRPSMNVDERIDLRKSPFSIESKKTAHFHTFMRRYFSIVTHKCPSQMVSAGPKPASLNLQWLDSTNRDILICSTKVQFHFLLGVEGFQKNESSSIMHLSDTLCEILDLINSDLIFAKLVKKYFVIRLLLDLT